MKKNLLTTSGCRIILTLALTVIALICVSSFSCQLSPEGITLLTGTYDCPKLIDFSIEGKNELQMTFTQEVEFSEMTITPENAAPETFTETQTLPDETNVTETDDGTYQYDLTFPGSFDSGTNYTLYAVVEDTHGNSLSFSSGFTGFNDNLPDIALSEVRTDYSKPKAEFIELYVTGDGNLGGLCLEFFYGTKKNTYIFPAVDVHEGEYIVLHLRTLDETAVDEIEDTAECSAADSCPEARDFWHPSEVKILGKTGVVLLRERENGPLVDALLFAESGKDSWPGDDMKAAAQLAYIAGKWTGGSEPGNAVCSDKSTTTRTLSRQDFSTEGTGSWIVVATSCATPGTANSSKPAK